MSEQPENQSEELLIWQDSTELMRLSDLQNLTFEKIDVEHFHFCNLFWPKRCLNKQVHKVNTSILYSVEGGSPVLHCQWTAHSRAEGREGAKACSYSGPSIAAGCPETTPRSVFPLREEARRTMVTAL